MSILPPEKAAELRGDNPAANAFEAAKRREAEKKEKDRLRKRDERARAKTEKETQAAMLKVEQEASQADSFPEYWAAQRATLTDDQRAEYKQRESDVLDLQFAMRKHVDGIYEQTTDLEDHVPLEAIIEEVKEEVATHGSCESIILVVPKLWASGEKDLRERILAKGGATALLLQYGYRTAVDGFIFERFYQKFLVKRQPRVQKPEVLYVSLRCSTCNALPVSVTSEIAAAYAKTKDYKCANCLDKAAKIRNFAQEQRSPEHQVFDSFNRVKDQ